MELSSGLIFLLEVTTGIAHCEQRTESRGSANLATAEREA